MPSSIIFFHSWCIQPLSCISLSQLCFAATPLDESDAVRSPFENKCNVIIELFYRQRALFSHCLARLTASVLRARTQNCLLVLNCSGAFVLVYFLVLVTCVLCQFCCGGPRCSSVHVKRSVKKVNITFNLMFTITFQ